jgi:hypothetical protein
MDTFIVLRPYLLLLIGEITVVYTIQIKEDKKILNTILQNEF